MDVPCHLSKGERGDLGSGIRERWFGRKKPRPATQSLLKRGLMALAGFPGSEDESDCLSSKKKRRVFFGERKGGKGRRRVKTR